MDHLRASFERELKNKLAEKTKGAQSEQQVLMKSFKYFDLNDNGVVEPDEFAKAIEKIGIQIPTQSDLQMLFNVYDLDKSGTLDYKEFSAAVFGRPPTASSGRPPSQAGPVAGHSGGARTMEQLAEQLKTKLASRGARGMIGLQRQFKIMDDDNSKSLSKYEFNKAMTDYMLGFSASENAALFEYFDVDSSGSISYDEFIRAVRGPMNMTRKKIVAQAFKKLDKDGNGWIDINDVRGTYNGKKHPDVISGKKTEDQILQEFLETFETAHNMRNNTAPDYVVTKEEFEEYYNNVSCSVDDDMYFLRMMNNAWKLDEESRRGMGTKGWSDKDTGGAAQPRAKGDNNIFNRPVQKAPVDTALDLNANEAQVIEHVRKRIAARGARGIAGIGRKFKIADDDNSKSLDKDEFQKAMRDFRIGLTDAQVQTAFRIFDRDGSGSISYDEFLRSIRGEMNATRKALAQRVYKIMDSDGSGQVDINDIRQTYNAKHHPDVKAGKKTEDEILTEFLDTFEDHWCDMAGNADSRDGIVTMPEWLEYYNNVSMSVDTDEYFKAMMTSAWKLDSKGPTKKAWGGEF